MLESVNATGRYAGCRRLFTSGSPALTKPDTPPGLTGDRLDLWRAAVGIAYRTAKLWAMVRFKREPWAERAFRHDREKLGERIEVRRGVIEKHTSELVSARSGIAHYFNGLAHPTASTAAIGFGEWVLNRTIGTEYESGWDREYDDEIEEPQNIITEVTTEVMALASGNVRPVIGWSDVFPLDTWLTMLDLGRTSFFDSVADGKPLRIERFGKGYRIELADLSYTLRRQLTSGAG